MTAGRLKVWNAGADAWEYVAPGGGSQPGVSRVVGPYHVDYTDIENLNDSVTLFTPTAGDVILNAFPNIRTYDPFGNTNGSFEVFVGQVSEVSDLIGWAGVDSDHIIDLSYANHAVNTIISAWPADIVSGYDSENIYVSGMVALGEAVVCKYVYDGGGEPDPLIQGSADWYFVISTPDAP